MTPLAGEKMSAKTSLRGSIRALGEESQAHAGK